MTLVYGWHCCTAEAFVLVNVIRWPRHFRWDPPTLVHISKCIATHLSTSPDPEVKKNAKSHHKLCCDCVVGQRDTGYRAGKTQHPDSLHHSDGEPQLDRRKGRFIYQGQPLCALYQQHTSADGLAEQYFNPPGIHPSLPNYLWLEAGTNFGILDDNPPSVNSQSTTQHLVTLLNDGKISWKAYEEDISGSVCPLTDTMKYAVKHDPFVYFDDVTGNQDPNFAYCISHVRPFTELASDLASGTVAQYNFITPNLCDDMHDKCKPLQNAIEQGDIWLSKNVLVILNSAAYRNGGALFITWDEAGSGDGPIGMIVLSPFAKGNGYENFIPYTHGSTLRTFEEIFGVSPLLNDATGQTDLSDLFKTFP